MPRRVPTSAAIAGLLIALSVGTVGVVAARPAPAVSLRAESRAGQSAAPLDASPLEVIRRSKVHVMRILRPGHKVTAADRAEVLRLLMEVTAFAVVSENVLGSRWESIPAAERAEFASAFTQLVSATSIAKMGRYRAHRFEYVGETVAAGRATVRTRAFYQGRGVSLDYEMALVEGRWRIVNYALNGVNNGQSYRRQFEKLLEKETVAGLIARLRKKVAEIETGGES